MPSWNIAGFVYQLRDTTLVVWFVCYKLEKCFNYIFGNMRVIVAIMVMHGGRYTADQKLSIFCDWCNKCIRQQLDFKTFFILNSTYYMRELCIRVLYAIYFARNSCWMMKFELEATVFVRIKATFLHTILIWKFKNNNVTSNSTHKRALHVWKLSGY